MCHAVCSPLGFSHALRGWENLWLGGSRTVGILSYNLGADYGFSEQDMLCVHRVIVELLLTTCGAPIPINDRAQERTYREAGRAASAQATIPGLTKPAGSPMRFLGKYIFMK